MELILIPTRNNKTSRLIYLFRSLNNFPKIIIRKAPARGTITNNGIRGFIF
jgi:hypothetical protein